MARGLGASWTRIALVLLGAGPLVAPLLLAHSSSIQVIGSVQGTPPPVVRPGQQTAPDKAEPPGNGAISGTVFDGASREPVVNVLVTLQPGKISKPLVSVITRQVTDERGRFAFPNLPGEGEFTILVSKYGYLGGGYGRDQSPTDPLRSVAMHQDEWVSGLHVNIWKPGSISGTVRDEAGEPVVGVFVRALMRLRIMGREDLAAGPMVLTDDRGAYRLSGLGPGRYYVQVPSVQAAVPAETNLSSNGVNMADAIDLDDTQRLVIGKYPLPPPPVAGRQMAYPLVFHPSTSVLSQATPIEVGYGDERSNIDLTLTPAPSVRVSGVVDGPPEALQSLTLRLLPAGLENLGLGSEAATALVEADGHFTFMNVPAGSYTLDAPVSVSELSLLDGSGMFRRTFPPPPPVRGWGMNSDTIESLPGLSLVNTTYRGGGTNGGPYSGRMPLVVGGSDVNNVVLRLRPHATMSGRLIVEVDPAQPDVKPPARFPLSLDPAKAETFLGRPQSSFQSPPGEFSITGIIPGQYFLRLLGYPNWLIKSIVWKGHDYTTLPFDAAETADFSDVVVTVTDAASQLSGTVRSTDDMKIDNAMVVIFPSDASLLRNVGFWPARMKSATIGTAGTYLFPYLPAGDYRVAAIDRARLADWRDPAFLERVARIATHVTLTWGAKSTQDLSAMAVR
jgi:hypothetical protein